MSSGELNGITPTYETDKEECLNNPSDGSTFVRPSEDPEKDDTRPIVCRIGPRTASTGFIDVLIKQGRPNVAALIQEAVKSLDKDKRVLIAACGPDGLMKTVRNTSAGLITKDGPSIELHCEQFGW